MFRTKLLKKGLVASVAAGGMLFAIAGPASAAPAVDVGAGAGTGWEVPGSDRPGGCDLPPPVDMVPIVSDIGGMIYPNVIGEVAGSTFDLYHAGTLDGIDANGNKVALYVGDTHFHLTVGEHVISPAGTSPDCPDPLSLEFHPAPTPLASATVTGTTTLLTGTGSVNCGTLQPGSSYVRVQSAVSFTFTVSCGIIGNVPVPMLPNVVNGVNVTFAVQGTMTPCNLVPPLEDDSPENPECTAAQLAGASVTDPDGSNGIAPDEPNAGSHLVTTHAAVGLLPA